MNIKKGVFGNQAKSVIVAPFNYSLKTESGDIVDAKYSYKGVINRIIVSPIVMGAAIRTVRFFGKKVTDIYFK